MWGIQQHSVHKSPSSNWSFSTRCFPLGFLRKKDARHWQCVGPIDLLVKLNFPSVAALHKSFSVLGLSQACHRFVFISPYLSFSGLGNVLVLSLYCPELALESAHIHFDVLAMTFLPPNGCWWDFERFTKKHLWSSPSPLFKSWGGRT